MFNKEKNEKYNGFLLVNKEKGYTSFDVCNKIKHKFNFKKVGHNGTLDPNATGLMVIGINKATKYLFKFNNDNKEYIATILFGLSSDSEDICGKIINIKKNININTIDIDDAINKIKNQTTQIPPVYSAIKINGKRSCDLIRKKNIYTDLKPREIKIYNMKRISKIYISENNISWNNTSENNTSENNISGNNIYENNTKIYTSENNISGNNIYKNNISGNNIYENNISRNNIYENNISRNNIYENNISRNNIYRNNIYENNISRNNIYENNISRNNIYENNISKIYTSENNTQQNYLCVDIKMLVSKGFYVRSFVRDLGNILNVPCLLKDLCRTKNGNYNIEESKKIDQVTISDIIDIETFLNNNE